MYYQKGFSFFILFFNVLNDIIYFNVCFLFNKYVQNKNVNRINMYKSIIDRLKDKNIVFIKIFQSLCLDKNLLNDDEKEFLLKYTDQVNFDKKEIDFNIIEKLCKDFNITLNSINPCNSGIIALVFKGKIIDEDGEKNIVVKLKKIGIEEKYNDAINILLEIVYYLSFIPLLNNIDFYKMVKDSKESILLQTNFKNEVNNCNLMYNKYKQHPEFVIPKAYTQITDKYDSVIVMEDITGLKVKDLFKIEKHYKEEIGKLLIRFGILGGIIYGCTNGDLHAGNVFFYKNENDDIYPYKLGIIDFGLCYFIKDENLYYYKLFFYDVITKKDYTKIPELFPEIMLNKYEFLSRPEKEKMLYFEKAIECINAYADKDWDLTFWYELSKLSKNEKIIFTKEFNNILLSFQVTATLGLTFMESCNYTVKLIMNEMYEMENALKID